MKKMTTIHEWNKMFLSLFQFNAGDTIDRHSHPFIHTTGVARGSTEVTIWYPEGKQVFKMRPGDLDIPFPPGVEHRIVALEDDTIIVNLSESRRGPDARRGGIAMDDGTVVYE